MLFNLLTENTQSGNGSWVLMLVFIGIIVVFMVFNRRSQAKDSKKRWICSTQSSPAIR
ncbi:MAG: hypothetical protein IKB20_00845 [Clostridia bacterium]|nr:hypothetical protein [Clostridia bacterium]